ncbi:sulfite exporter TauE/SafE family protein [Allobranchiibius sp. GilTou38]|uniref:sulfite exporter TauE/SafE family protein n=1 Tax=Allobranchiibius sp. GilTou38 TaxID=2815210 RepID=UPI001AA0D013|nr:sulfite exporter TauE/SafE family protein [Allobranchiibius sp. GilTou38]MBO1766690.1 sulfite exporter TauE/SafE family protein [Allobranchiibius sp. GilTou38]
MMTVTAAALLGLLIGISLGALGGGGSILTVPALVYALGEPAQAATTGSLVIVGVTSLIGALGHSRAGNVRWVTGVIFGVTGIAASLAGTALNRQVDPNALLLAFAALMAVAAVGMLRRATRPSLPREQHHQVAGRFPVTPAGVAKFVAAGLVVGFLTGFLGVGGGFVIVPALVMALDFPMPAAVGTSLLVIALNSAAALMARAGHATFHWSLILPFTAAAIAGSLLGSRVADRTSHTTLSRAFAGLLVLVATYVAARSAVNLA